MDFIVGLGFLSHGMPYHDGQYFPFLLFCLMVYKGKQVCALKILCYCDTKPDCQSQIERETWEQSYLNHTVPKLANC